MIRRRTLCLLSLLVFLILCAVASVSYGAKPVSLHSIFAALGLGSGPEFEVSVVQARIPRTLFGVIAGAALGISGALMQALTRNPIADPSILGINTGASLFVVSGMAFFHISSNSQYIWLAFAGAALTAVAVYGLASLGHGGATPIKLALAGAAASTALQSLVNTVMLPDTQVMDRFRFWQTGSIGGVTWEDIAAQWPYLAVGFIASLLLAPALNTLALGDEVATGLGLNVALVRGYKRFGRCAVARVRHGAGRADGLCWADGAPLYAAAPWAGYALGNAYVSLGWRRLAAGRRCAGPCAGRYRGG